MKKVIMGIGMVGLLFISLASAGLVDFLSNTISVEVVVEGPVFYLDATRDSQYDTYYTLKMNDDDVSSAYPLLSGNEQMWFLSETLGIDTFYEEKYDIELRMKAVNGNESKTGNIMAELWIGDEDNLWTEKICETNIFIGISRDLDTYNLDCVPDQGKGLNNMDDDEKIMLVLRTSPSDIDVKIFISSSKIEVLTR